jgi:hypothetical protein
MSLAMAEADFGFILKRGREIKFHGSPEFRAALEGAKKLADAKRKNRAPLAARELDRESKASRRPFAAERSGNK